jgi:hypothetical protein
VTAGLFFVVAVDILVERKKGLVCDGH